MSNFNLKNYFYVQEPQYTMHKLFLELKHLRGAAVPCGLYLHFLHGFHIVKQWRDSCAEEGLQLMATQDPQVLAGHHVPRKPHRAIPCKYKYHCVTGLRSPQPRLTPRVFRVRMNRSNVFYYSLCGMLYSCGINIMLLP